MVGAALDTTAAMYAWGHLTNNGSTRETGVVATKAVLDVLPYAVRDSRSLGPTVARSVE